MSRRLHNDRMDNSRLETDYQLTLVPATTATTSNDVKASSSISLPARHSLAWLGLAWPRSTMTADENVSLLAPQNGHDDNLGTRFHYPHEMMRNNVRLRQEKKILNV